MAQHEIPWKIIAWDFSYNLVNGFANTHVRIWQRGGVESIVLDGQM